MLGLLYLQVTCNFLSQQRLNNAMREYNAQSIISDILM